MTGWGLRLPDDRQMVLTEYEPWVGPVPPVRLEGHDSVDWRWPEDKLFPALLKDSNTVEPPPVRGYVRLANGKAPTSDRHTF